MLAEDGAEVTDTEATSAVMELFSGFLTFRNILLHLCVRGISNKVIMAI